MVAKDAVKILAKKEFSEAFNAQYTLILNENKFDSYCKYFIGFYIIAPPWGKQRRQGNLQK